LAYEEVILPTSREVEGNPGTDRVDQQISKKRKNKKKNNEINIHTT
jgi:hypothetical protein